MWQLLEHDRLFHAEHGCDDDQRTGGNDDGIVFGELGQHDLARSEQGRPARVQHQVVERERGQVTIDFTNQAPLAHNVTIEAAGGKILGATPTFQGGTKTLTLQLPAGTYKFFCSVPGHRQAGMEGTLTVK